MLQQGRVFLLHKATLRRIIAAKEKRLKEFCHAFGDFTVFQPKLHGNPLSFSDSKNILRNLGERYQARTEKILAKFVKNLILATSSNRGQYTK